ncbi:hypothetical protein J6590_034060 [Homalodisca vitripennis]|nr:hypothetical protein J6590_034060 [Homalodisca vitripennis]
MNKCYIPRATEREVLAAESDKQSPIKCHSVIERSERGAQRRWTSVTLLVSVCPSRPQDRGDPGQFSISITGSVNYPEFQGTFRERPGVVWAYIVYRLRAASAVPDRNRSAAAAEWIVYRLEQNLRAQPQSGQSTVSVQVCGPELQCSSRRVDSLPSLCRVCGPELQCISRRVDSLPSLCRCADPNRSAAAAEWTVYRLCAECADPNRSAAAAEWTVYRLCAECADPNRSAAAAEWIVYSICAECAGPNRSAAAAEWPDDRNHPSRQVGQFRPVSSKIYRREITKVGLFVVYFIRHRQRTRFPPMIECESDGRIGGEIFLSEMKP